MNIDEIYDGFEKTNPKFSAGALGWSSLEAQQTRFRIICEIGIDNGDSVLDVGCGYGDFSYHVGSRYLGIDLRENAIKLAKEKYKLRNFAQKSIFDISEQHDWVVGSGIFCFSPDKEWSEYVHDTLKKMYELSKKGVAVNFLSGILNKPDNGELVYAFPQDVIRLLEDITSKFTIRHDYQNGDFTLYLYK